MNTQLKYQIQEHRPQCRCEDYFGTDSNPHNERCSICDEGASGVADKVAKATQLCVDNQRQIFKYNFKNEIDKFMRYMDKEHLEMILDCRNPSDLLDWFERYDEPKLGYIFQDIGMNLRLQKDSDQKYMLGEISYYAVNELWILNEKKRKEKEEEPKKKRIIRKKVCNGLRCSEHSYEPMDCWYDCPKCCERGHP